MDNSVLVKNPPLVSVQDVCQSYDNGTSGQITVLDNINMELRRGEIVGLLGRSGSGKSTLLRAIAGLIQPTKGTVTFEGKLISGTSSDVAVVFQNFALFPWLTVLENVEIGLEARGIKPAERRRQALSAIDLIGLDGYESAYPKELSGGMRQRVGLARALVVHPKLLLMDEPFSALDVLTSETLRNDLLDLWSEGRMPIEAILMVTHNIEDAVLMCDHILIFGSNPGHIIGEIHVDLPQPRNRLDPAFREILEEIYSLMTSKTDGTATLPSEPFVGNGIAIVLPKVSVNELAGLIETIAAPPYNGKADLPPLAASLRLEIDDLFPVGETLQLLRFVEMEKGDIRLTPLGQRFVESELDDRKHLFSQQLSVYVPLAAHIRCILDERPSHKASAQRFREELQDYMSEEAANDTIKAVTSMARYAEYFAYDEESDLFTLDNPS
ncbi:MAG: nitrate/sulfonate/bicarbonate ABC transporter ATP-binding protein [Zymomonas mobilis]|uniref:ABC nitrate/sulfonate/bicarbonate family transporter, ATPase subunit n=1 Tax=Zymomonas mobilis subsp. mobilis (strain ATCC 10988 / DSM 424 / LMG 404 / NCIMB 8938 / NRRL B-806 / ZM1) TaxID=555217 RepID=A0A0H3FZ45_ZYMMA|nr:nitrate/sulfonate/bicarbonate ABC transporter ATP-binding protein [Zymomonas mobilis]ACV75229.1 ABC transporter related [Zymomonas mobilis subsp. mobilis NCIMB 11163]AEH62932.1 ABC nitrate/sulfonate/bicarbonate family transporter, ATPase subunit [Zymomonas mobilis subsp. mobilis ATCC 10988]AHB10016.1 ABC-type nitrate/sulfonate/bicarbonate transport system, ATPase component [Zymomonas mobilis subsp. mobilis str. CP4 = NRRL B-14023]AHJ70322.1 Bicarbonate transport ATP-binding protein CmpC [Zym